MTKGECTVQTAQQEKPKASVQSVKKEEKKTFFQKLYDLPQAAGIALMVVLLVVSLFVGNFRALKGAEPGAFLRQGSVQTIVEDRIAEAGNVLVVAKRENADAALVANVETAQKALNEAETAREISAANALLTTAVSELTEAADGMSAENQTMLMKAADAFAEQGSFLRQEAKAFNKQAEKAKKLYEKLPTRALFEQPDWYEGL